MVDYSDLAQPLNSQQSANSQYADLAQPLQDGISQTQSPLQDFGQGLVSGLTEIPRAINKVISPVTDAVAYLPAEALRGLTGQQLQNYGQYQQDIAQKEQQMNQVPQTGYGQTGRFIGSAIPTLAMGAEGLGTQALIGGGLGAVNAINKGENLPQIATSAGTGALTSAVTGGVLKAGSGAFNALAPQLGKIAGIPGDAYRNALSNVADMPVTKELISKLPFINQLPFMPKNILKQAGQALGVAKDDLVNKPPIDFSDIEKIVNDTVKKYTVKGATINPVADEVKPVLDKLNSYITPVQQGTFQNQANLYNDVPMPNLQAMKEYLQNETEPDPNKPAYSDKANKLLSELTSKINNKISDASPEMGEANKAFSQAKSASKFSNIFPQGGHQTLRALSGGGALLGGALAHSPYAALGALFSPSVHGLGMSANEINSQISPYLPAAYSNALTQYMNQQGGQ